MTLNKENLIASSELVDIYKDGDKCVKLFKEGVRKTNPLYEALTHSRVEDTGLRVPIIHELSVIDGRWAIVMDLIEGKTLADLMQEHPENMDQYLNDMVDIQLEIHSKTVPKLSKLKDKMGRQINSLTEIDDVKKYELLTRLESMPKHTKLCHGNFVPENIIYNEKGIYVVDWIAARQGNASADVGRTYLLLSLRDPKVADKYLDLFCEKTHTSKKYVQQWLPIVAAAYLPDAKPEEHDFLMKWVDVVEYE
ncbi:MAG TPA: phosphotransferase [Firmicutes bacterium]|nr:phosphotransferase [Bacillota bacterium]